MGGVNKHDRCDRCERWIEADSPSDSLCIACYQMAESDVPFEGGQPVFTPEEWTDIILDANLDCYLDPGHEDQTGGQS